LRPLDRDRILKKIDELDGYLRELSSIRPVTFEEYVRIEKKRSCERLLQLCIECVVDICALINTGLRLGIPSEENDLFEKLERSGIISSSEKEALKRMKAFRNILVHEYGHVDDSIVYDVVRNKLDDFDTFRRRILQILTESGHL